MQYKKENSGQAYLENETNKKIFLYSIQTKGYMESKYDHGTAVPCKTTALP